GLAAFAWLPAAWIAGTAETTASLPAHLVPWLTGMAGVAAFSAVAIAVALVVIRPARLRRAIVPAAGLLAITVGVVAGTGLSSTAVAPLGVPSSWAVGACDVGQGDGLLVRTGPDAAAVVDTGPDPAAMKACLTRVGVTHLSLLLLTHLHADHVEGVPGVLAVARPDQVLTGPLDEPQSEGRRVRQWLREEGLQAATAPVGDAIAIGNSTWEFLWPRRVIPGDEGSEPNNASVVAVVRTPAVSVLLTGDVEPEAQRALRAELADRLGESGVDVLKVPHHGSAYQDSAFLAATQARLALISVGAGNDYGHPAPSTVATLSRLGMRVERTDLAGGIAVVRRGGELLVSPQRREDQESE
ncbi:MAG: ComEC/Rec2 family competence protein, partial [Actinomycetes bacterium]